MTAHDPLAALRAAAAAREAAGLRRALSPRQSHAAQLTDLASNDYLGLATHSRLIAAAMEAAREWGTGSTGSRLVTGTTSLHTTLERALAGFLDAPAALVFSSGYLANIAAVTSLAAALGGPLIVSDSANHASLIDACRLTRARVEVTPHQAVAAVERALARRSERAALVVTESAFSLGGRVAPLAALHRIARAHGAVLVIDEAHALGVVGAGGRGAAWQAGIAAEPDVVRAISLSKSLGSQGGAVLGAPEVIGTLVDTARAFIFDTGLAPPAAGAALRALELLAENPAMAAQARLGARRLALAAADAGFTAAPPGAAVVSIVLGSPGLATRAQRICADHGVRVGCFRPPSVPAGQSCLRLAARATLTAGDLTTASRALMAVRDAAAADGVLADTAAPVGRR
jgi:8-amino-7-oxononanoate synthase